MKTQYVLVVMATVDRELKYKKSILFKVRMTSDNDLSDKLITEKQ